MPKRHYAITSPDVLRWARESGGLSPTDVARRVGIEESRLNDWEGGWQQPTVAQLRELASVYKRPLAAFFLPEPPREPRPPHDFRRVPGRHNGGISHELALELRRARRRRAVSLELLEDIQKAPMRFPIRSTLSADPEELGVTVRRWLNISSARQQSWKTEYEALNGWLATLESRDVLVFQTSHVPVAEMRGFSISEELLPVIVLNSKDSPYGRVFTLLHELIHLTLQRAGVCNPTSFGASGHSRDERVEVFCNMAAGAVLIPADELMADHRVASSKGKKSWDDDTLRSISRSFGVSREVVLRRLLLIGRTSKAFYERKRAELLAQYRRAAQGQKPLLQPHRAALRDNGKRFTHVVLDALKKDRITPADTVDYLGIRLKHIDQISALIDTSVA